MLHTLQNIILEGTEFRCTLSLNNIDNEYIIIKYNNIFYPLTHSIGPESLVIDGSPIRKNYNYLMVKTAHIKHINISFIKRIIRDFEHRGKACSGYNIDIIGISKDIIRLRENVFLQDFTIFPVALNICGSKFIMVTNAIFRLYKSLL